MNLNSSTHPGRRTDRRLWLTAWLAAFTLLLLTGAGIPLARAQTAEPPVVHAVLFWMDGCPHCREVIENTLPRLQTKYGAQLDIRLIELFTLEEVELLYDLAARFGIPRGQVGVPLLVLSDQALVGGEQIPDRLPGLIEESLAGDGAAQPDITPFDNLRLVDAPSAAEFTPDAHTRTPDGYGIALATLALLAFALLYSLAALEWTQIPVPPRRWAAGLVPLLAVAGLGVAAYLAYVETQAIPAVCGPVGDCNAVQSSAYARLFGVLPLGVLGVVGYLGVLAAWAWGRLRPARPADLARRLMLGMTLFGTLFSLYLTWLEAFVIRAVCLWCIASALIMALLLLLAVAPCKEK